MNRGEATTLSKFSFRRLRLTPFFSSGSRIRFSLQEQALFAKRLSLLVKAGVPILDSLKILQQQANSRSKARVYGLIINDIANGKFLSQSITRYRRLFGDFAINIIKIGETNGMLSENLKYLAEELDKRCDMRKRIMSALIYPAVIIAAAFGVSGILTVYLFPKLLPVFQGLKVDLPWTTRALIRTSDFLVHDWLFVIITFVACIIAFAFLMRFRQFRMFVERMVFGIPFLGQMIREYHLSNMCRTLGVLMRGFVTVLEGVKVTADTTTNLLYERELCSLGRTIARGGNIAGHLGKNPRLFPVMLTQMVAVGERTGNLSETLLYLADIYEKEFEEQTRRLSTVIEPALMILMGVLVGFIAISIITPIYAITQHLHP